MASELNRRNDEYLVEDRSRAVPDCKLILFFFVAVLDWTRVWESLQWIIVGLDDASEIDESVPAGSEIPTAPNEIGVDHVAEWVETVNAMNARGGDFLGHSSRIEAGKKSRNQPTSLSALSIV